MEQALLFIKNTNNLLAEYQCKYCGNVVIRYKSNAKRVMSCGCRRNIKHGKHGCSNTYLYKVYKGYENRYKKIEFKDFMEFNDWARDNGWFPNKVIIRKNTSLGITRDNLIILDKEEGIKKVRRKSSETTPIQKTDVIICYSEAKKQFKGESQACILNLVALQLKLTFCDVFKIITGNDIDNNEFDSRKSYKRSWYLFNNKKKGKE